jgi:hypothetical protein
MVSTIKKRRGAAEQRGLSMGSARERGKREGLRLMFNFLS